MTNMVDLASRLAGFGPVGPGREERPLTECPNCRVKYRDGSVCPVCQFPKDKDPDEYSMCEDCGKWTLFVTMTERPDGWYCPACHEEAVAQEIDRATDPNYLADRKYHDRVDRELESVR